MRVFFTCCRHNLFHFFCRRRGVASHVAVCCTHSRPDGYNRNDPSKYGPCYPNHKRIAHGKAIVFVVLRILRVVNHNKAQYINKLLLALIEYYFIVNKFFTIFYNKCKKIIILMKQKKYYSLLIIHTRIMPYINMCCWNNSLVFLKTNRTKISFNIVKYSDTFTAYFALFYTFYIS